jgi:hypothetical protein
MPGKRITDHQVHKYKQHRNQLSQVASAAKAGISERSARRIEQAVTRVLDQGLRTADIMSAGMRQVGTSEMGDAVLAALGQE